MNHNIANLHVLTQDMADLSHVDQAKALVDADASWIQLRVKTDDQEAWFETGRKVKELTHNTATQLIINDNVYLAKEIEADGVHLGKEDMSISEAREILGTEFIIGATANSFEDILSAVEAGADYIGLGPFRETPTKKKLSPVIPMFAYEVILKKLQLKKIKTPVIAIGGILPEDVVPLMVAGISGIAVSSAIVKQKDVAQALNHFNENLSKFNFVGK